MDVLWKTSINHTTYREFVEQDQRAPIIEEVKEFGQIWTQSLLDHEMAEMSPVEKMSYLPDALQRVHWKHCVMNRETKCGDLCSKTPICRSWMELRSKALAESSKIRLSQKRTSCRVTQQVHRKFTKTNGDAKRSTTGRTNQVVESRREQTRSQEELLRKEKSSSR